MDPLSRLSKLVDEGLIEEVVRPLLSGKEAQVFVVIAQGQYRVAKIYKEANNRTFKQRSQYTEGRQLRNTRDQRAVNKRTKHGRAKDEEAWRVAEVDMLYRLSQAGVRVPKPDNFVDGILLMELVADATGQPAPQLAAMRFEPAAATRVFEQLLAEVVRMLAAGVVHGDLSEFNVLMDAKGPVIIDLPQAVDAASNQNARKLLVRDVNNLQQFFGRFVPGRKVLPLGQEMWQLYERGELQPDTKLTGQFKSAPMQGDVAAVLDLVADAAFDERQRRQRLGKPMQGSEGRHASRPKGPSHRAGPSDRNNSGTRRGAAQTSDRGQHPRNQQRTNPSNSSGAASPDGRRQHSTAARSGHAGSQSPQGNRNFARPANHDGQTSQRGGSTAGANEKPAPRRRRRNRRR